MLNSVNLIGRLTNDPSLMYTPSGVANATFTLAVDRDFKNKNGDREADFIRIVVWRQLAELCANYIKKGSQVCVAGRIQTGSYEKDGKRIYTTDIVAENVYFLTPAGEKRDNSNTDPFQNDSKVLSDEEIEDLPF